MINLLTVTNVSANLDVTFDLGSFQDTVSDLTTITGTVCLHP